MANTGIYTLQEFKNRQALKLAPDMFITVMGKTDARVLLSESSIVEKTSDGELIENQTVANVKNFDFKGGLLSVNTDCAAQPGAGTCTISFSCPTYDSLNENYYITLPNGTKSLFFQSMMEVRVYSKGRFLSKDGTPIYYPVFWGFITTVNEDVQGNNANISLACRDCLGWWEYQYVNIVNSSVQEKYGGNPPGNAGSLYRFMNPWACILNLFRQTGFDNFIFPTFTKGSDLSQTEAPYTLSNQDGTNNKGAYELLAGAVIKDWKDRYGLGSVLPTSGKKNFSNLEMYGISGRIDLNSTNELTAVREKDIGDQQASAASRKDTNGVPSATDAARKIYKDNYDAKKVATENTSGTSGDQVSSGYEEEGDPFYVVSRFQQAGDDVVPDFGIMGETLPFGNMEEYQVGTEPVKYTKLETASRVADSIGFEFFQDTNGVFVFKPPFFNMNVIRNKIYVIKLEDILSFNAAEDSTQVVTFMEATAPLIQLGTAAPYLAYHVDFAMMDKYGIREKSATLMYGGSPRRIRAMACSEMAKANINVFTASLTIVHRPELRVGYPIYIDHLDTFYYVKSINHSLAFGSSATTTLSLCARRTRVYNNNGELMRGYIYKPFDSFKYGDNLSTSQIVKEENKEVMRVFDSRDASKKLEAARAMDDLGVGTKGESNPSAAYARKPTATDRYYRANNLTASPTPGFWVPVQATSMRNLQDTSSDANKPVAFDATRFSELYMFQEQSDPSEPNLTAEESAKGSHPYTDINGFQHIGGFPYGATLIMGPDSTIRGSSSGSDISEDVATLDLPGLEGASKTVAPVVTPANAGMTIAGTKEETTDKSDDVASIDLA
jgi:hypothetical protein